MIKYIDSYRKLYFLCIKVRIATTKSFSFLSPYKLTWIALKVTNYFFKHSMHCL